MRPSLDPLEPHTPPALLTRLNAFFIQPDRRITNPQDQIRARLLAQIHLGILGGGGLLLGFLVATRYVFDDLDFWAGVITWFILLGNYLLARRGNTTLAATVLVTAGALLFTVGPLLPAARNTLIYFAIMPILVAAIFFSFWPTIATAVAIIALANVLVPVLQPTSPREIYNGLQFLAYASVVVIVLQRHLQLVALAQRRELETALAQVRASEQQLEQRVADRTAELTDLQAETERLLGFSQALNAANSTVEIATALTDYLALPDALIAVARFDTGDRLTAHYADLVVWRPFPRGPNLTGQRLPNFIIAEWDGLCPLVIPNAHADPRLPEATRQLYLSLGAQSGILAALTLQGRVPGLLAVAWPTPHTADARLVLRAEQAASVLAATLERVRLYDEQVRTAEELRTIDQSRAQFLASISHELRTPLNAVINFTQFVSTGMFGAVNDRQREALGKSTTSARHLLRLINDVLDMSRIEAGRLPLVLEHQVDISPELTQSLDAARATLANRPITLTAEIAPDIPPLTVDRQRVRQVLDNLLSNACKFTDHGQITLAAHYDATHLHITVKDTGPGIAPDDQPLVFEPFRQPTSGARKGGAGLGLSIAKALAEAHGGRLWFESTPGAGATFHFVLPLDPDPTLTPA